MVLLEEVCTNSTFSEIISILGTFSKFSRMFKQVTLQKIKATASSLNFAYVLNEWSLQDYFDFKMFWSFFH